MSVASVTFKSEETGPNAPEAKENNNEQQTNAAKTGEAERPAWLPSNFASVEAFLKSTEEQRATLTRTQQELAKLKKELESSAPAQKNQEGEKPAGNADEAAAKVVEQAGFDVAPYQQEFNETGDVSPENRKKIAEGLKSVLGDNAESVVNDYIEGQRLRLDTYRTEVMKTVGGEEKYAEVTGWAANNLKPEEIEAFNRAVDSGDINAARIAVDGLYARYVKENGSEPELIGGENGHNGGLVGFKNAYEMRLAMSAKDEQGRIKYKTDPAYRARVEARAKLSNF